MTVTELLEDHTPAVTALTLRLRKVVRSVLPDAEERVYAGWHGIGYHAGTAGYVVGIFPQETTVRLVFEHGKWLPDRHGVLEGTGAQTRHIELSEWDDRTVGAATELILIAVDQRT